MTDINEYDRKLLIDIRPISGNPRCFIEIEACFTGTSKHVLGSLINSSILGYYGVLVAEDLERCIQRRKQGRKCKDVGALIKIRYFLVKIMQIKDIMRDKVLGKNVFIASRSQFENILKQIVEKG